MSELFEPVRTVYFFDSRRQVVAVMSMASHWQWDSWLGRDVSLWIGPDAAFPFRYVAFSLSGQPHAFLEARIPEDFERVRSLVESNPKAPVQLSTLDLPPPDETWPETRAVKSRDVV